MAILKNEPVFDFKDGNYSKPRHIIVKGSYEEIGFAQRIQFAAKLNFTN